MYPPVILSGTQWSEESWRSTGDSSSCKMRKTQHDKVLEIYNNMKIKTGIHLRRKHRELSKTEIRRRSKLFDGIKLMSGVKVSRFFEKNILREVHIKVGFSVNQFCQFTARESRSKHLAGFLRNLLLIAKLQFILEVKNYARAKHQAARRWVSAVNHWGKL